MDEQNEIAETKGNLSADQIEEKINNKILEARLIIAEKRLQYFLVLAGGLLVIFGLILPMILAFQSTDRVDKALERMESRFKELAGTQLREPELACYVKGKKLENRTLYIDNKRFVESLNKFEIRNVGDGTARNIRVRVYIKSKFDWEAREGWSYYPVTDEPDYPIVIERKLSIDSISPKGSELIYPKFYISINEKWSKIEALFVIYYGQPEPTKTPFFFEQRPK